MSSSAVVVVVCKFEATSVHTACFQSRSALVLCTAARLQYVAQELLLLEQAINTSSCSRTLARYTLPVLTPRRHCTVLALTYTLHTPSDVDAKLYAV
jgi:hypothetical protein